jgi:hypothetical protein
LTKNQDSNFAKVLDWTVKYDSNKFVRDMAIALGAAVPEVQESAKQPSSDDFTEQTPDSSD